MIKLRYILFTVLVMTAMAVAAQEKSIVERAYWFDYNVAGAQPLSQGSDRIDVSALSRGIHTFSMRVKDNAGLWSSAVTQSFIISLIEDDIVAGKSITEQMYWFDYDAANAQPLSQGVNTIDVSALSPGLHFFTMRVKDSGGLWSSAVTQFFVILSSDVITPEESVVERCLYWFDDNYSDITVVDVGSATAMVPIDVSGLAAGEHTLYWRVGDSRGVWSQEVYSSLLRYKVPASGLGTFSATENMLLPEGLTAHHTTVYNDRYSTVHVTDIEGQVVPAATGVLLKGEGGEMFTLVPTDDEAPTVENNTLVAVVEATHVPQTDGLFTNFMLKSGVFIRIAEAPATSMMPAHRAYLQLPTEAIGQASGTNDVSLEWGDDEATGIVTIDAAKQPAADVYYDLQGRRVNTPQHGVYITNGKKVIIK